MKWPSCAGHLAAWLSNSPHGDFTGLSSQCLLRASSFRRRMPYMEYKCKVDENNKATELPLLRLGGTVQQNPHMRAFWASTISFFLAFLELLGCASYVLVGIRRSWATFKVEQSTKACFRTATACTGVVLGYLIKRPGLLCLIGGCF